jgi:tRNA(fMet)-specific endonuclease VapC
MLILDTDLLTLVQRGEGEVYARLAARLEAVANAEKICVTIISYEEQMRGWLAFIAGARTAEKQLDAYRRLHELFDDFHDRMILDYDGAAVQIFQRMKTKVRVGSMDLKIAAIALANNAKLLSRNIADYRKVPDLQVEDWTLP